MSVVDCCFRVDGKTVEIIANSEDRAWELVEEMYPDAFVIDLKSTYYPND